MLAVVDVVLMKAGWDEDGEKHEFLPIRSRGRKTGGENENRMNDRWFWVCLFFGLFVFFTVQFFVYCSLAALLGSFFRFSSSFLFKVVFRHKCC